MRNRQQYTLSSNEWAVPYWLLATLACFIGIIGYFVNQVFGQEGFSTFTKIVMVAIIVLLSVFYKKLYITPVIVQVQSQSLILEIIKLTGSKKLEINFSRLESYGAQSTEGTQGWIKVPKKHWLYINAGKKKYYLYEENGQQQITKIIKTLQQYAGVE